MDFPPSRAHLRRAVILAPVPIGSGMWANPPRRRQRNRRLTAHGFRIGTQPEVHDGRSNRRRHRPAVRRALATLVARHRTDPVRIAQLHWEPVRKLTNALGLIALAHGQHVIRSTLPGDSIQTRIMYPSPSPDFPGEVANDGASGPRCSVASPGQGLASQLAECSVRQNS